MAGARDAMLALLLALGAAVSGCGPGERDVTGLTGRARADALVAAYAAERGAGGRTLDDKGDVTFGSTGLFHAPAEDALYGRVYVNNALIEDAPPAELANYRRMVAALNDPKVGGMYPRGGGYFVLDEQRQAYFLVRRFPLALTDPGSLSEDMALLERVAARWTAEWLFQVAMVMHGRRPAPTRPVTLE